MKVLENAQYKIIDCDNYTEWLDARKQFIPASEYPMIMGDFKGKSSIRLWKEKQGIVDAANLDDNEAIQRGREREPIIRLQFAERHPALRVDHYPYRIYVSKDHPFMSCTLDGFCLVTHASCEEMAKGSYGSLECKSVGYRSRKELEDFRLSTAPATKFYEQTLGQTGIIRGDFCYIAVELAYIGDKDLQGDLPDYEYKEYFFTRNKQVEADIQLITQAVCEYKDRLDKGLLPDTHLSAGDDSAEVVVLKADVEVGRFFENFDKVKASVAKMVEPYKGVTFTSDQARDAKAIHAELNNMVKSIDEKRVTIKKKYLEPYDAFEAKAKELKAVIDEARIPIKEQIDEFARREKEEKTAQVRVWIADVEGQLITDESIKAYFDECGGVVFQDRWLNKSVREKSVRDDIAAQINDFLSSYETICSFIGNDTDLKAGVLSEYARTRSLKDALKAKDRILASREMARRVEEVRQQREIVKRGLGLVQVPAEAIPHSEDATIQSNDNPKTEQKIYTFTFKASHSSQDEWRDLIAYMKAHGFVYEQIR